MNPSDLLDLIKTAHGLTSDYQVMKKYGFSQTGISKWRTNRSYPKNSVLIKFGEILEINAGVLMLHGLCWREKDIKAKAEISLLIDAIANSTFDESFIDKSMHEGGNNFHSQAN